MRAWWLVLLVGCKELPEVEHDTCGNAVVEPDIGEDCDLYTDPALGEGTVCGAAGTAQACRYLCDSDGTPACPEGWGCGADGVCRYPSGSFEALTEADLDATDQLDVADFDGNGKLDLIARAERVEVAFNLGGTFVEGSSGPIGDVSGPIAVGDLDDDGRADAVVPTRSGDGGGLLVFLGQAERALAPLAFSPYRIDIPPGGLRLVPIQIDPRIPGDALLLIGSDPTSSQFVMFFISDSPGSAAAPAELQGRQVNNLAGRVAVGDVNGDGSEEIALAFVGADRVFVYTMLTTDCTPTPADPCMWQDTDMGWHKETPTLVGTVMVPAPVNGGAFFADNDGDGDLDLFISVLAAPGVEGIVRSDASALGFAPVVFDPRISPGAEPAVLCTDPPQTGRTSGYVPLTGGDLDGDGDADFVTRAGIYLASSNTVCVAGFDLDFFGWSEAALGDFNHDGVRDVVTAHDALPGVDVYLGIGDGHYVRHRIDTSDPPAKLRVADYDGDLIDDVAFAEERADGHSLAISFGTVEGAPSAPVTMGRFQYIVQIEEALFQVIFAFDGYADLVVQTSSQEAGGTTSLALLFGTQAGRMVSSFVFQVDDNDDVPLAALIGRFNPGDAIADMAAATETRLWRAKGAGSGQFNAEDVSNVAAAGYGDAGASAWQVVDVDGDSLDEIVGVSDTGAIVVAAPTTASFTVSQLEPSEALTGATGVAVADLDGDGGLDLVAAFAEGVRVFPDFDGAGLGDPIAITSVAAEAVRAVQLDRDRALEIVILDQNGVSIVTSDGAGGFTTPAVILPDIGTTLAVGDLDGDGLDDLAVGDGMRVRIYRTIANDEVTP